jgi:hypothetical protein
VFGPPETRHSLLSCLATRLPQSLLPPYLEHLKVRYRDDTRKWHMFALLSSGRMYVHKADLSRPVVADFSVVVCCRTTCCTYDLSPMLTIA